MKLLSISFALLFFNLNAHAFESADYKKLSKEGDFEIRQYEPMWLAESQIDGMSFDASGDEGFKFAGNYMFGANRPAGSPTVPSDTVNPEDRPGSKLGITSPVMMQPQGAGFRVSFLIPKKFTEASLPVPTHRKVLFRKIPGRKIVAVRYSGDWSQQNYLPHEKALREFVRARSLTTTGEPIFARYDPPFWPKFMRRNEVWFELVTDEAVPLEKKPAPVQVKSAGQK